MKDRLYLVMIFLLGIGSISTALPKLSSYPSATAVIFLDFDGHTVNNSVWNNGNTIECKPSLFSDARIIEIFNRVAEDFRPFNINITTDSSFFLAAPLNRRMRVIITPTNYWRPGAGGIAWLTSFTSGDDTPCFVFCSQTGTDEPKGIAEVISHEAGHTLGLLHQASYEDNCTLITSYHPGSGTGETSWAPIMGSSVTRNLSLWNFGPTQIGCFNRQDNLYFIITLNGFGYREDDHSDDISSATPITLNVQQFETSGVITTTSDNDIFRFDFAEPGNLVLSAYPFSVNAGNAGANLDIKLTLMDGEGTLINVYDPASVLHVQIDTSLHAGVYYISIDGTGNVNTKNDYGSLGLYNMSGYYAVSSELLAIRNVQLSGYADINFHHLIWNIESDEPIREMQIEWSLDGVGFDILQEVVSSVTEFRNSPAKNGNHYYRLRVTSVNGEIKYSNILKLAHQAISGGNFIAKAVNPHELIIRAETKFEYQVFDHNGRLVSSGNGSPGTNRVNISAWAGGIYFVRLIGADGSETKRIFKP